MPLPGWCSFNLVNYPDVTRSNLYGTRHIGTATGLEYEKSLLTEIDADKPRGLENMKRPSESPRTHVDWQSVQYMYNSNQLFFAHLHGGDLYRIRVTFPKDQPDEPMVASITKVQECPESKIVSTSAVGVCAIVETFDKLFLLHPGGVLPILQQSMLSVRTYPQSRQYRRLATAVTDEGVYLLSVFDDDSLVKKAADTPIEPGVQAVPGEEPAPAPVDWQSLM